MQAHRVTSVQGRMVSMPAKKGTESAAFMAAAWRLMPASSPKISALQSPAYSILRRGPRAQQPPACLPREVSFEQRACMRRWRMRT